MSGRIWGHSTGEDGELWWQNTGSPIATDVVVPPGTDAVLRASGGFDGRFQYLLALDNNSPTDYLFWVEKFNSNFTTLLARWPLGSPQWRAFFDDPVRIWSSARQHVSVSTDTVTVIIERHTIADGPVGFDIVVFNLDGTVRDTFFASEPGASLSSGTGTCMDFHSTTLWFGRHLGVGQDYLSLIDLTGDSPFARLPSAPGALHPLVLVSYLDAQIAAAHPGWGGLHDIRGMVLVDSSTAFLTICGQHGLCSILIIGPTVVGGPPSLLIFWATPIHDPDPSAQYLALADSGNALWACDNHGNVDEFSYAGEYLRTITIPESVYHAWLGQLGGWILGEVGMGGSICTITPIGIDIANILSTSTTPDGLTLVVVSHDGGGGRIRTTIDIATMTIIESAAMTVFPVQNDSFVAGDDGWIYGVYAGTGVNYIHRWPILTATGTAEEFATYSGPTAWIGFNGILAFDSSGNMYGGGSDINTTLGTLYSIDRVTGVLTVLVTSGSYDYIEPVTCTADGAVWGWAVQGLDQYPFRWDGSSFVVFPNTYPNAESAGGFFPLFDGSVAFNDGDGSGLKLSPVGALSGFDCLDGTFFSRDYNGPSGPNIVSPSRLTLNRLTG